MALSVLELLLHPDELLAVIRFKFFHVPKYVRDPTSERYSLRRSYELLDHSSRSFAMVIKELHPEIRDVVMVFYLVLRCLDTIEDDTELDNEIKLPMLRSFAKQALPTRSWMFEGISEREPDRIVCIEFPTVLEEYHRIPDKYREVIYEIAVLMGNGMADYIVQENQENYDGVKTIADYRQYCHHVAGILGLGLSKIAIAAGFGDPVLLENEILYEDMGQFLQRTNILRDYPADIAQGRSFYPQEVWKKYVSSMKELQDPTKATQALHCQSEMVLLSLRLVVHVLEYLRNVTEPSYFRFCAIPQVMSIATLDLVFGNPEMFQRIIKIRRATTVKLILESSTMDGVYAIFRRYVRSIHHKNKPSDPNYLSIELVCADIEVHINKHTIYEQELAKTKARHTSQSDQGAAVVMVAVGALFFTCSLMVGIAWYAGARFDLVWSQVLDFVYEFQNGPGSKRPSSPTILLKDEL